MPKSSITLSISVVCFAVVWGTNQQFLSLISIPAHPELTPWIQFLSAAGLFGVLYEVLVSLANTLARRIISDEAKLIGEWYQVFEVINYTKSANPVDAVRHGRVSISMVLDRLEISATNERIGAGRSPSTWHSNMVTIQGHQVWLLFSSNGPGRGTTHGNMLFQYDGEKRYGRPRILTGQFSDSSPATHFGTIQLFRDRTMWETRLKEIADAAGAKSTP